jgi:hypothetical protein
MFTRDIRTLIQIGKSGVKWNSSAPAANAPWIEDTQAPKNDYAELRRLWDGTNRSEFKKKLAEVTAKNEAGKNTLMNEIEWAIATAADMFNTEEGQKLQAFRTAVEKDFAELAKKNTAAKTTVQWKVKESVSLLERDRDILERTRTKYDNRLNFNDIMALLQKPDFSKKLANINPQAAYLKSSNQSDAISEGTNPLIQILDDNGYIGKIQYRNGKNNYQNQELVAILELSDELKKNLTTADTLMEAEYQRSQRVEEYDPNSPKVATILQHLADLSGDGLLTAKNAKDYSTNVMYSIFEKLFNTAKDTNLHIEGELPLFQAISSKVSNFEELKKIIAVRTGLSDSDITVAFKTKEGFKVLVREFQRGHLIDTAKTSSNISREFNEKIEKEYQIEKAKNDVAKIQNIKEKLWKGWLTEKVKWAMTSAGIKPDGKTVDDIVWRTAVELFKWNPQFFASLGLNTTVTDTETITTTKIQEVIRDVRIVNDHTGTEVSRTSTDTNGKLTEETSSKTDRTLKANPTILIGFNQDIFRYKSERTGAGMSTWISALAGIKGIRFPITASAYADLTVKNDNSTLQTESLSGNWVIGGRIGISKDLKSWDVVPSFGIDVNPNDVKNAIEKQEIRLANLFNTITVKEDGSIDLANIKKSIAEQIKSSPNDTKLASEVRIMNRFLADLETSIAMMSATTPADKKALLGNNILAFQTEYLAAVRSDLRWLHVAGVNISFISMIYGKFLGLNIQHVQQKSVKVGGTDMIEERLLTLPNVSMDTIKWRVTVWGDKKSLFLIPPRKWVDIVGDIKRVEQWDGSMQLIPADGKKLSVKNVEYTTKEWVKLNSLVIMEENAPIEKVKKATVTPSDKSVSADTTVPVPERETIWKIDNIYDRNRLIKELSEAKTTEDALFVLSRGNKSFVSAMKSVLGDDVSGAITALKTDKMLTPFVTAIEKLSAVEQMKFLDNLLFATSGSRSVRGMTEAESKSYNAEYAKNKNAFGRRLSESMPGWDKAQMMKDHVSLWDTLSMKNNEVAQFKTASSLIGSPKDISGLVTFSQIDANGRLTIGGMKAFHGDITIVDKIADITNNDMKLLLIESAKKEWAFQKNMESTNAFIVSKTPSWETPAKFDTASYQAFLLTGELPKEFSKNISIDSHAKFHMARCALPGAVCFNDVMLLGYPKITVTPLGKPPISEAPTIVEVDLPNQMPTLSNVRSGDRSINAGGESSGTFGLNISKVVNNVVQNVVENKIITTIQETVMTQPKPTSGTEGREKPTSGTEGRERTDWGTVKPVEQSDDN